MKKLDKWYSEWLFFLYFVVITSVENFWFALWEPNKRPKIIRQRHLLDYLRLGHKATLTFLVDVKVVEQTGRAPIVLAEWTAVIQARFSWSVLLGVHPTIPTLSVCARWWLLWAYTWPGVVIKLRLTGWRVIGLHRAFRCSFLYLCAVRWADPSSRDDFIRMPIVAQFLIVMVNGKPLVPRALLALAVRAWLRMRG